MLKIITKGGPNTELPHGEELEEADEAGDLRPALHSVELRS